MNTPQFLEFVHDSLATRRLAEDLAEVLALRGRADLVPARLAHAESRRIAVAS